MAIRRIHAIILTLYASLPLIIAIWQIQKYRNTNSSIPGVTCAKDKGPGNTDMYGLGVRIATYIQVLVGIAATTPGAKRGALISNVAFLAAFTTAVWVMLRNSNTDTLDLYVVIVLGNGLTVLMCRFPTIANACVGMVLSFIHTGSLDDYHTSRWAGNNLSYYITNPTWRTSRTSRTSRTLRTSRSTSHTSRTSHRTPAGFETVLMMLCQLLVLGLWKVCTTLFWWRTLPAAVSQPGCEIYGYLFVRAILEPGAPIHTFHKVLNIVGWVYWFICVMVFILSLHRLVRVVIWGDRLPTGQKHGPPKNKLRILFDLIVVFPSLQQVNEESIIQAYHNASSPAVDTPDSGFPDEDTPDNGSPAVHSPDKVSPVVESPGKGSPDGITPDKGSPDEDTPDESRTKMRQKPGGAFLVAVLVVAAGYYLIIPVEFIIAINRIPGVNVVLQTGQLLPLVASICILCAFSVDLCIEVLEKQRKEESDGGGGGTIANSPGVIQDSQISGALEGGTGVPILIV